MIKLGCPVFDSQTRIAGGAFRICNRAVEKAARRGGHFAFEAQPYKARECEICIGGKERGVSWMRVKFEKYSENQRSELFFRACFRLAAKIAALGDDQK